MSRFRFKIRATAPGCRTMEFIETADTEREAVDSAKSYAADYLGVREEHLVLKVDLAEVLF